MSNPMLPQVTPGRNGSEDLQERAHNVRVGVGDDAVRPTSRPIASSQSAPGDTPPNAATVAAPTDALPTIEMEPDETIYVAAGGKLIVPREDLFAELDDGAEMDLVDGLSLKHHKPHRREWIA